MSTGDQTVHLATTGAGSREESDAGLAWFTEQCMTNGAPLERYIANAERLGDYELARFFRRALAESRRVSPIDRRGRERRARSDRRRG